LDDRRNLQICIKAIRLIYFPQIVADKAQMKAQILIIYFVSFSFSHLAIEGVICRFAFKAIRLIYFPQIVADKAQMKAQILII